MQTPSSMCEQPKILLFSQESGCSTKKLAGNVQKSDAYSARTAHPFRRNGAPFRFKLSKAQLVD